MASDNSDAYNVLQQWIAANPGREWRFARDMNQRLGQPGGQSAQQDQGNWGIWIDGNNRFANQPGQYARGETPPLYRFPSREAAEQWIEQQRAERPNLRTDIEVREIAPRLLPGSTLDLQRQRAAAASQGVDTNVDYEIYNRESGNAIRTFQARNDDEAMRALDDHRALMPASAADRVGVRRGPSVTNTARQPVSDINLFPEIGSAQQTPDQQQGGLVDVAGEQPAAQTGGQFTGEWKVVDPNGREIYRFSGVGNSQSDANNVAIRWLQQNPRHMQGGVEVLPVMG
jgi:hypothetical protein